jgi:Co/Zn/Cd efflux system component
MGSEPEPVWMMGVSTVALVANVSCLYLISRHRQGGAHMKASWIFSTNDVVANLGVIGAGLLVSLTQSRFPDLVIGAIIATIVLTGSVRILRLR